MRTQRALLEHLDLIVLLFTASAFFGWFSQHRVLALDGGFYLYAARLVARGELPYLDFFYPQMPLLPYVYGLWGLVTSFSWESARLFSAAWGVLAILLAVIYVRPAGRPAALLMGLIVLSANYTYPWLTIVKSYSLTLAFLLGSCAVFFRNAPTRRHDFYAGILFACAVQTRMYVATAALVFLLWPFCCRQQHENPLKRVASFIMGAVVCSAPLLFFAVTDWDAFLFNNLGYHLDRTLVTPSEAPWIQRGRIAMLLFGFNQSAEHPGYLFGILTLCATLHVLLRVRHRALPDPVVAVSFIVLLTSFAPTPVYLQYFCLAIPGMAIGTVLFLHEAISRRGVRLFILCLLATHNIIYLRADIERYTESGEAVIGIRSPDQAATWNLSALKEITDVINSLTSPGEEVLANWEGFFANSHAVPLKGTENRFGVLIAKHMGDDTRDRMAVVAQSDIRRAVVEGRVRVVVTGRRKGPSLRPEELERLGFQQVHSVGLNTVWLRANPPNTLR